MTTFYVSLVRDLMGVYLEFEAETERALRQYLEDEYYDNIARMWKLPWCAVYTKIPDCPHSRVVIVKATCGPILKEYHYDA